MSGTSITATSASNDDTTVTYTLSYSGTHQYFRVYVDTDRNAASGFATRGIGAEYLIENAGLYRYAGTGANWAWTAVKAISLTNSGTSAAWTLARADLQETDACAETSDLLFDVDGGAAPIVTQTYLPAASCSGQTTTPTPTSAPISNPVASNDEQTVTYQFSYSGAPSYWRVYIDTDQNPATGFAAAAGIGADYLLEGQTLYQHSGAGWSWTKTGTATFSAQNQRAAWTITRAAIGETAPCGERSTLLFQTEGATLASSAPTPQVFTDASSCTPPTTTTPPPTTTTPPPTTTTPPPTTTTPPPTTTPPAPTTTTPPPPTTTTPPPTVTTTSGVKYVFIITMENESAAAIYGSTHAPYINTQLVPRYARANAFADPLPDGIPSEPHYVWMEAGTNAFADTTFTTDSDPSATNSTRSTAHLVTQMAAATPAVSWLSFQEGLNSATGACPVHSSGFYVAKHNPFVFFQDVAGSTPSATNTTCADHHRAFTPAAFSQALSGGTVAQYNFITPNACNDMHGASGCPQSDNIAAGDQWLQANLPPMIDFVQAHDGVIFVVWDEPVGGSTLIPFLAIGPHVKAGYANQVPYTHSSLTKSVEEIFGLPLLPTAAGANDFKDLFQPGFFP